MSWEIEVKGAGGRLATFLCLNGCWEGSPVLLKVPAWHIWKEKGMITLRISAGRGRETKASDYERGREAKAWTEGHLCSAPARLYEWRTGWGALLFAKSPGLPLS